MEFKNVFVTAKLLGADDFRQGVIINVDPLIIRGQSGEEYECEGEPVIVVNPPETCIGCGLPLGGLCGRCESNLEALKKAMNVNGIELTYISFNK